MEHPFQYFTLAAMRDIKQYSCVDYYYSHFEFLRAFSLNRFPGICDAYFLSRFINGLKSEIQVYVLHHHPSNLLDAYDLALVKEYSIKCAKKPQSTIEKAFVQVVLLNEDEESFIPSVTDSVVDDTCTTVNDYTVESPSAILNSPMAGNADLQTSVEDVSGSVYTPVSHTVLVGLSSLKNGFSSMDIKVLPAVKKDFSSMTTTLLNNSVNADDELQDTPWMAYNESCSIAQLGASLHVLDKRCTFFSWYSRVCELIVADPANFGRGFLITNEQSIVIDILPSKEDDKGGTVMLDTAMLTSVWVHGNVFHGNVPNACASLETIASSTARKFSSDVSFTSRSVHLAPKDQPMFSLSWTYGILFPVRGSLSATLGAHSLNRFRRLSFAEGITVSSIPLTPTPRRTANFQVPHVTHVVFPSFVHDKTWVKGNGLRMDSSTDVFI